jgi:putative ABC transport system permease protein
MTIPRLFRIIKQRLSALFRRERLDSELDQELMFHLEQLERENLEAGMSAAAARREARRALGNIAVFEEECRDERRVSWFHDFLQDVRYGGRLMRKHPAFTAIAAVSLALGIGGNAAIINVAASILLVDIPLPDAGQLVVVQPRWLLNTQLGTPASVPEYIAWKEGNHSFESMGASIANQQDLTGEGGRFPPKHVSGHAVTPSLFTTLRVKPQLGTLFTEADAPAGGFASRVVVLSYGLWQDTFEGDREIIGKQIRMNGEMLKVVAVMPRGFWYPIETSEYWVPLSPTRFQMEASARLFQVTARLKPGTTLAEATSDVAAISAQLAQDRPDRYKEWSARIIPLRQHRYGWIGQPLMTLEGALIFVLLVACANVSTLLLSRVPARQPEITMRLLMGAGRSRILRQFLTESLLLSVIAGVLATPFAWWGIDSLIRLRPPTGFSAISVPGPSAATIALIALLSIISSLLFGVLPALVTFSSGADARQATVHRRKGRLSGVLVSVQVALALVLLISSGLLINSFVRMVLDDRGFDPEGILTFEYRIPITDYVHSFGSYHGLPSMEFYPPTQQIQRMYEQLKTLPGAEFVAGSSAPPVNVAVVPTATLQIEGKPVPASASERSDAVVIYYLVTDNFFKTMQSPIQQGRDFSEDDKPSTPWVTVINETLAQRFWPGEDPIGKHFKVDAASGEEPREVIGVVKDLALQYVRSGPPRPVAYALYNQQPAHYDGFNGANFGFMTFLVRSRQNPASLELAARRAAAAVDSERPLSNFRTMTEFIGGDIERMRYNTTALAVFALMATLLASIGVYGVVSASVSQRTREIGIRLAMGARAHDIVKLASIRTLTLVATGLLLGTLASLALTRVLRNQLWGVGTTDPATYLVVIVLLSAVSLAACLIPARRATRVNPTEALRMD